MHSSIRTQMPQVAASASARGSHSYGSARHRVSWGSCSLPSPSPGLGRGPQTSLLHPAESQQQQRGRECSLCELEAAPGAEILQAGSALCPLSLLHSSLSSGLFCQGGQAPSHPARDSSRLRCHLRAQELLQEGEEGFLPCRTAPATPVSQSRGAAEPTPAPSPAAEGQKPPDSHGPSEGCSWPAAQQPPGRPDLISLPGTAPPRTATGAVFIIPQPNAKQTTASACLSHYGTARGASQAHFDSA